MIFYRLFLLPALPAARNEKTFPDFRERF
jgi:hypothetical protein